MDADVGRGGRSLVVSVALAAGALAVFLLLPQRVFHGVDSDTHALMLEGGNLRGLDRHAGYLPFCWLVLQATAPFGAGAVQALLVASALGSALGVFFVHRAALRLAGERDAALVAIALAVTPGCFYFATAVEIPGVLAAFSGAAWWLWARFCDRPHIGAAVALGAMCGAAGTVHALGHLLSPLFVLTAAVLRTMPPRRLLAHAVAIVVPHALAAAVIAWSLGTGPGGQASAAIDFLIDWARTAEPGTALAASWHELFAPFLPWSALAVIALFLPRSRAWGLAWLAGMLMYLPVVGVFLARGVDGLHEQGAYVLPMAVPAVLASVKLLPRRWPWLAIVLSAAFSLLLVAPRWTPPYSQAFVNAFARLRSERDLSFLVGPAELQAIRTHFGTTPCAEVDRSLVSFYAIVDEHKLDVPLAPWFDAMVVALCGTRSLVVTADAEQRLLAWEPRLRASPALQARAAELHDLWHVHVPATYDLEPLERPGLAAVVLTRR